MLGFGNLSSGNSALYDRILYIDSNGRIVYYMYNSVSRTIFSAGSYNDGAWHHAAATVSPLTSLLYVDGVKQASMNYPLEAYWGFWRLGGDVSRYVRGRLDEAVVYNRALSAAEIKALWRRGANRLKLQVRACSSMTCADNPGWQGPDGGAASYFSELYNTSLPANQGGNVFGGTPDLFFSSFAPTLTLANNPYLQYRAILESDDAQSQCSVNGVASPCSPELLSVRVGPSTYPTAGSVTTTAGLTYHRLTGLNVSYGPGGCPAGVTFNLSNDGGITWYWFNGYLWQNAGGTAATSNAPAQLTASVLDAFIASKGVGPLTLRAFLASSGATPCALASASLQGGP